MAIHSESGDSWNPAPGNKLYEREAVLCRKVEEARADYETVVQQTTDLQRETLCSQLPQVCGGGGGVCVCVGGGGGGGGCVGRWS